jgi:hypothetical protein
VTNFSPVVVDTGNKLPPVSLIPVANLLQVLAPNLSVGGKIGEYLCEFSEK